MRLSGMSNRNIHMVKKSTNCAKKNHGTKCADIDFSYKKDANVVNLTANLQPLPKAPEQIENYTLFN